MLTYHVLVVDKFYCCIFSTRSKKEETPSLLSADMRREIERKKWEEEETETMKKEKEGPIHYADVQHSGKYSRARFNPTVNFI